MTVDYNRWLRDVRAALQSINMPMDDWQKAWHFDFRESIGQEPMPIPLQPMPIVIGGTNKTRASAKPAQRQRIAGCHATTAETASRTR